MRDETEHGVRPRTVARAPMIRFILHPSAFSLRSSAWKVMAFLCASRSSPTSTASASSARRGNPTRPRPGRPADRAGSWGRSGSRTRCSRSPAAGWATATGCAGAQRGSSSRGRCSPPSRGRPPASSRCSHTGSCSASARPVRFPNMAPGPGGVAADASPRARWGGLLWLMARWAGRSPR